MSQLPQTYVVNTTSSTTNPDDDLLTLGEAIAQATGKGDKIVFDQSLIGETVHVSSGSGFGPMDFTDAHGLIIDGDVNGDGMPDISISGDGFSGLARIEKGSSVTLHGLKLIDGKQTGLAPSIPTADYLNAHDIIVSQDGELSAKAGEDAFQVDSQTPVNQAGGPGGNGANGYGYGAGPGTDGNGFDGRAFGAIVNAGELTLDNVWMDGGVVVGDAGVAVNGGRGGTGATGVRGDPASLDVDTYIAGGNGGKGGNAGDGGNGGVAAPIVNLEGATLTLNDTMISGYDSIGGAGGNGGTGGAGGNGGNTSPATNEDLAGHPADGGNGGNGGNGGMGVGIIANYGDLILQTNFAAADNTEEGGGAGGVGAGGARGILNGFGTNPTIYNAKDGAQGTSVGIVGTTQGGILQNGDVEGPGSTTPTTKLMFMNAATPTQFEGNGDHASAFNFDVLRFGDLSEAATFTWKIDFKSTDTDDFISATSGTFNVGANISTTAIAIQLKADNIMEGDETFVVKITNTTPGVGLGTRSALFTILDDDGPTKSKDNIISTDKSETIDALAGNDTVQAMGGNDTVIGGLGSDMLTGGLGADRLTGGAGADVFVFSSLSDSVVGKNRDVILDFSHRQHDQIDLSPIDAKYGGKDDAFHLTAHDGSGAFTHHKGELRISDSGLDWLVQLDINGDGKADSEIALHNGYRPTEADFML